MCAPVDNKMVQHWCQNVHFWRWHMCHCSNLELINVEQAYYHIRHYAMFRLWKEVTLMWQCISQTPHTKVCDWGNPHISTHSFWFVHLITCYQLKAKELARACNQGTHGDFPKYTPQQIRLIMCSNHVDDKSAIPDNMSATPLESKSHAHTLIGSDIAHKNTTLRCYLIWHTQNNGVRVDITLMYTHMMLGLGGRGARDQKLIHWAFGKNNKSPTTMWTTDSIQLHLSHLLSSWSIKITTHYNDFNYYKFSSPTPLMKPMYLTELLLV